MARTRVRIIHRIVTSLALTAGLALTAACGTSDGSSSGEKSGGKHGRDGAPVVVATTTWEGAFAKAAGAKDVKVIVPQSVHHAPDYDPKPSDLAAVAEADFVLYAPFEPYAEKIKEAAGSEAELVEVALDNDADKVTAEVARLGEKFGTQDAAAKWKASFGTEYAELQADLKAAWPGGKAPAVVTQVFTAWSAKMAGANVVGTYGPEAVTAKQLAELSAKNPALVLDNAHMSTGVALPDAGVKQVKVVNYPGEELDLLPVYRNAATAVKQAMTG
ncbi:ABC transporter substrate-binding protein [Streptomyces sp. ISL-99]|uniref:metal ABC transporter substrate-binding protein n=1 Tax=Streptomyces sp. ISL-99 TaxID=2819193 RepID=UPI001BE66234|nr:metal ABC transporter substrate-binding protein [Streptomyces sp. ISL-99]MBT2525073.1 ABC transporter substrate-binding protein [Streptomyces sp. ISL-99]